MPADPPDLLAGSAIAIPGWRPRLGRLLDGWSRAVILAGRPFVALGRRLVASRRSRLPPGPWRVAVAEGSMLPTLRPGDWLLVDPTVRRWPRPGSLVVIREPGSELLALKRVAARGGAVVSGVQVEDEAGRDRVLTIRLLPDQAWLLSDADPAIAAAAGFGPPIDSRRYGPVAVDRLVARVWFRYWPPRRIGPLARPFVRRGRAAPVSSPRSG